MACLLYIVVASMPTAYCLPALSAISANSTSLQTDTRSSQQNYETTIKFGNLATNCSAPCTESEFSIILETITAGNSDILQRFGEIEQLVENRQSKKDGRSLSGSRGDKIRPACLEELINLIKSLAANELEMKSVFEFATSDRDSDRISYSSSSSPFESSLSLLAPDNFERIKASLRSLDQSLANRTCINGTLTVTANSNVATTEQMKPSVVVAHQSSSLDIDGFDQKSSARFLPKLVTSVDHWINTLERFTMTKEWSSLMRVFQGTESILEMFVANKSKTSNGKSVGAKLDKKFSPTQNSTNTTSKTTEEKKPDLKLEKIKQNLPGQVMSMTSSLNSLFPWHVWPWNNVDLYSTIDTFLNHGIFAFSKTTVGPKRRIDNLPDMLRTLFVSLKFDSFPKKCADWSQIICDKELFHDRLTLKPLGEDATEETSKERLLKVRELSGKSQNQLTQEITCIMFSSLSVQHFGGIDKDLIEETSSESDHTKHIIQQQQQTNRLSWDIQVKKGIKLYTLAREALSDEQWLALYNLVLELWSQQKIPDRVIMVSRVIQLLTNCHMPKEMLESALWKDIYKYKNVLNQLLDIVVEELNSSSETGKFKIEQMSFGSSSLSAILDKFIRLLPRLIEALSRTTVDELPELVGRFFNEKQAFFNVPCKGYSFSDIIPSLSKHRDDIVELEDLVCKQLKIKPNITMMQINNLTNDFLAMALNFSSFGGSLSFPKLYTDEPSDQSHLPVQAQRSVINPGQTHKAADDQLQRRISVNLSSIDSQTDHNSDGNSHELANVSSIIDEIAANPRMAQIVAILQSSALDPPEVHAVLPELDWVEAGTSIAMLYESIQKLLSYEQIFVIFPEIEGFQDNLNEHILKSREIFKKFSKRDPIRLVAYSLDTMMPIALRTFRPSESFNSECLASFRDIFSEFDIEATISSSSPIGSGSSSGANRQWQCFVSSLNFASWATNQLIVNFNQMFKNLLTQMSSNGSLGKQIVIKQHQALSSSNQTSSTSTMKPGELKKESCIFLDGSVSLMLDNLPQFIDLALETVLMASTSSVGDSAQQQLTLYDILCSSNYVLDPFDEQSIEVRAKMKEKMCHLFHKKSLDNCGSALELDEWKSTMSRLNSTWFETNALSLSPSFREITLSMHKLLELFGQFKPSTMSDSLIARILNVNSFWSNLSNRIMNIINKYQEKRFEYALQTLTPIIYDNIPKSANSSATSHEGGQSQSGISSAQTNQLSEIRETLTVTILGANAVLNYLNKQSTVASAAISAPTSTTNTTVNNTQDQLQDQIQSLFNWADQYSMVTAETVLRTVANNITKLESIFKLDSSSSKTSRLALDEVWHRFCLAPIDQYLELKYVNTTTNTPGEEILRSNSIYMQMKEGKEILCKFRWYDFYFQLGANSTYISKSLLQYPESQLTRIALTKWGQVLDAMLIESKHIKQLPKFFYMSYWQEFKDKLPQISPLKDQPSNLIWIWHGFEQIVNAIDSSGNNQTANSLFHILDQLNCGLDAVKGGLSWENIANIYQDKQDILAAHTTINNGFALASIGVDTLLTQQKFQKFLDEFIKPNIGLNSFCEARNRTKLELIFSIPEGDEFLDTLESFQELICDTSFETLARNINPISVCYQQANQQLDSVGMLASTVDRFFKLASLAILDAKLIAASEAKPPLLDRNQWSQFWLRWADLAPLGSFELLTANPDEQQQQQQQQHPQSEQNSSLQTRKSIQSKRRVSLAIFRAFQVVDSINSNSLIWNALFKATHELCEIVIYLKRIVERRNLLSSTTSGSSTNYLSLDFLKETSGDFNKRQNGTLLLASNNSSSSPTLAAEKQQLVSVFSNILFPEINNFISFRTFKQLRYMKTTSDYFLNNPAHYELICATTDQQQQQLDSNRTNLMARDQLYGIRLIGLRLDSYDRLSSLLCHYDPSQWLRALNIATSSKSPSISKKVNLMTKYMSTFSRNVFRSTPTNNSLVATTVQATGGEYDRFTHIQQLDNVGTAINLTISYLLTTTDSLKSLSFRDLTNISWRSLPNLFDSIDRHLCASKYEPGKFYIPTYEPKRMKLETIMCNVPHWNLTQVYDYFSENFDLHNMISLIATQQQQEASSRARSFNSTSKLNDNSNSHNQTMFDNYNNNTTTKGQQQEQIRTCATPFKFASRWLKIGQELASDFVSKDSRSKIKKCMGLSRKEMSFYSRSLSYIKLVNSFILSLNDLKSNDSWFTVKKTWTSFSQLLLEQTASTTNHPKY